MARIKGWQKNGLTLGTELETSEVINLASKVTIDNVEARVSRVIQGGFLRDPHHKLEIEHMYWLESFGQFRVGPDKEIDVYNVVFLDMAVGF